MGEPEHPSTGRAGEPRGSRPRFPGARTWLPVAASALIVTGLAMWRNQQHPPRPGVERTHEGSGALVLLEPVGPVADPPRQLRWTRDPGASSYRVELFDKNAVKLGASVTSDTVLAIELLTRQPVTVGQWRVVPLGPDGLDLSRHVRAVFVVAR